jgi:SAM-dependent methyltransferase
MTPIPNDEAQDHNLRQRAYFERASKKTMVPVDSPYLQRHINRALRFAGYSQGERVLEAGCGMGRYTLLLAARGVDVTGLDLSPVLLDRLRDFNASRSPIPLVAANLENPPVKLQARFDLVLSFFALHHLHDITRGLNGMRQLLKPDGRVVLLEPNPYNPLYYLQILLTPGMTWAGERGLLRMRPAPVFQAMHQAGLKPLAVERFGCLPPQVVNQSWGERLEERCERFPLPRSLRPFVLFKGRRSES